MTGTIAVLKRATELIEHGWAQGAMSRDARGRAIVTWSPGASVRAGSWCVAGAIHRASLDLGESYTPARMAVSAVLHGSTLTEWNDAEERTKDHVLSALREAITEQEEN